MKSIYILQLIMKRMQEMRSTFLLPAKYGFTLIELIVVIGIMAVMSSVVLANHAKFGEVLLLRNLTYEVALSIREMQVYGLSAKKSFSGVVSDQKRAHGVYFNISNNRSYIQFVDNAGGTTPYRYDGSVEMINNVKINPKYIISELCAKPVGGSYNCSLSTLHISFVRPNPDAIIRDGVSNTMYEEAKIKVTTRRPNGTTRAVVVGTAGQISVIKITN